MKKYLFILSVSLLLIQCNKKNEGDKILKETDSLIENPDQPADTLGTKSYCYLGITGKDSVFVTLDNNLGTVTGKMAYKNHEKDSSIGNLSGSKSGDTLKLTYEFVSEGATSKRDIFFIQKDNSLTEGIGEQKNDNGDMKYADEKKVSYDKGQKLETADCKMVNNSLK